MTRQFFYIACLCLCLSLPGVSAEKEPRFPYGEGSFIDTEVKGIRARITVISYDEWCGKAGVDYHETEKGIDTAGRRMVTDLAEIDKMLPVGASLHMSPNEYIGQEEVDSFTAANGMKIINLAYESVIPVYFPHEAAIMFMGYYNRDIQLLVDARTGEDVIFDNDIKTCGDGSLRIIKRSYPWDHMSHIVQYYDGSTGDYLDLCPLVEFTIHEEEKTGEIYPGESSSYKWWVNLCYDYTWVGNTLYAASYDSYYRLEFQGAPTPAPFRPAPPVYTPRTLFYETDVRDPLTIDYGMVDRKVSVKGHEVRYRRIPKVDFERLLEYYEPRQTRPAICVLGLDDIEAALPEYTFTRFGDFDGLYELRKGNEIRVLMDRESEGYYSYYPEEDIITYFGGHSSDQSLDILTGLKEDYNPGLTIYSPTMSYRITGLHDGQDSHRYRFQRLDAGTGKFTDMFYVGELFASLDGKDGENYYSFYPTDFFWIGDTCYFRYYSGNNYCSVTMSAQKNRHR